MDWQRFSNPTAASRNTNPTLSTPDPDPGAEIGLMTWREFLDFRNPSGSFHPSSAYDFSLFHLNRRYPKDSWKMGPGGDSYHPMYGSMYGSGEAVWVEQLSGGYQVSMGQDKVIAVIHDGIAYYDDPKTKGNIPLRNAPSQWSPGEHDFGITSFQQVEDLSAVVSLINPVARLNEEQFPVVLQRIRVKGEAMTVRAEKEPLLNKGVTLAVFNSEGLVVAQAQEEWGATLLTVAQEYRGKGLGKVLGQFWYDFNPSFKSGGFTAQGQENALALWRDRVHEFRARGWYSDLIRRGRLTHRRVNEILAGLSRPEESRERLANPAKRTRR